MSGYLTIETRRPHLYIRETEEPPGLESTEPESWADEKEIDTFDEFVQRFRQGDLSPEEFKRFRLQHGVYGQRQGGLYMIRVKIPGGGLTARQLGRLADVVAGTPSGTGHVTTRQNLQLYSLTPENLADTLRHLARVGLTSREACGNTVRNVVACPHAGVAPDEPFDVTPYAEATARFLLRNPMNQHLPRKFKISFTGCQEHCGLAPIQDIGAVAVVRGENGIGQRGFRVYVGGGLGASPQAAQLLEEFTPADDLLVTIAAIIRVFDRTGNRDNRNLARLKFVLRHLGLEKLRALVFAERGGLRLVLAGMIPPVVVSPTQSRPTPERVEHAGAPSDDPVYRVWERMHVRPQKQAGYAMVSVALSLGDVTAQQLRVLAFLVRQYSDGTLRTTNQQNVLLRWIPRGSLPAVFRLLTGTGLTAISQDRRADIACCPGPGTCQVGITSSRGLALAIGEHFRNGYGEFAEEAGIRIRISGCPNGCGHHHLADIGFSGGAKEFHGQQVPTYQVYLGASLALDRTTFARPAVKVPAKHAPALAARVLDLYRAERREAERFDAFVGRVGLGRIREYVQDLTDLPPRVEAPDKYADWGSREAFTVETGPGECAS